MKGSLVKKKHRRECMQEGFTLIEFLVYSVLVTILVGSLVLIGVNILQGRARMVGMEEVNHNGKMAIERIAYHIRKAESINFPPNWSEGVSLSLEMKDPLKNPTVFEVGVNDVLTIKEGPSAPVAITTEEVDVFLLKFTNVSIDTPGAVRVELTLEYSSPRGVHGEDFRRTFYTTENIYR